MAPDKENGLFGYAARTDMVTEADPVANPAEYQQLLLSLLGSDDPSEVQRETPRELRALVRAAGPSLRNRPEPAEWSVLECVGHVVDGEIVASARYRWILAHDRPPLVPYDQDLWVTRLRHGDADPEDLIRLFEPLRAANLQLWARTSAEDRARVGIHAERGPESYDLTFRLTAGHDRFHAAQARRTLERLAAGT
jgi:hypothetical protein